MESTRVDVSLIEASKTCCDVEAGLTIPMPPRRTGRASRSLSSLEQGGWPVKAGIRACCMDSSNGCSRSAMSGMVLDRKDQRLERHIYVRTQ